MTTAQQVTVTDVPHNRRYEARAGDSLAGVAAYIRTPEMIVFVHTEVEEAFEGRGVGSTLARRALSDARVQGLRVLAICPFIKGWIARHPEYQDLEYEPVSRVTD